MNTQPRNINELRRLLAMGQINEDDLRNMQIQGSADPVQNALRDIVQPDNSPRLSDQQAYASVASSYDPEQDRQDVIPQNSMRNNETGNMTYFGKQGGFSDKPNSDAVMPGQPQGQAQGMTNQPMRVIGTGNGTTVELSPEVAPAKVNLDYSQAPVELMGGAKAYYSKDQPGVAYSVDGSGRPTAKILLGYDLQGSMGLTKANLDQQHTRQEIAQSQASVAHTQEQIRASQVNNPDFGAAAAAAGGMTGPDLLKTVDPGTAATVKSMLDGRMQPPGQMALRNPRVLQLINLANQVDPSFDATAWGQRYKTAQDFSSGGKSGQTITAFNTVLGHLSTLDKAGADLNNYGGFPFATDVNSLVNTFEAHSGDPRMKSFQQAKDAVTGELVKAFQAGHISDSALSTWGDTISAANSPEQMKAVIKQAATLLGSKINEVGNSYIRGMNKSGVQPTDLLSPEARASYFRILGTGAPTGATGGAPQAPASAAPATGMPNIGEVRRGYRYKGGPPESPASWVPA